MERVRLIIISLLFHSTITVLLFVRRKYIWLSQKLFMIRKLIPDWRRHSCCSISCPSRERSSICTKWEFPQSNRTHSLIASRHSFARKKFLFLSWLVMICTRWTWTSDWMNLSIHVKRSHCGRGTPWGYDQTRERNCEHRVNRLREQGSSLPFVGREQSHSSVE